MSRTTKQTDDDTEPTTTEAPALSPEREAFMRGDITWEQLCRAENAPV